MAKPINLNEMTTRSKPAVHGNIIWFQGTDDKLWRLPLRNFKAVSNPLKFTTSASPGVGSAHGLIYFRGTDNKLWQINLSSPAKGNHLYGMETRYSPCAPGDGHVYIQGTDQKLWQVPTT